MTLIPFRKATVRKRAMLSTFAPGAALGGRTSWELDSKGFLGGIRLLWSGSETTAGADPVAVADYPWAVARRIELRDSSGGMVASLKGYSAFCAKTFLAPDAGRDLSGSADTRIYLATIAAVAVNPQAFSHEIDVETGTKDNLGVLPNQNAAFKYTLDLTVEDEATLTGIPANATWALTVQPSYRYYTVPAAKRADGVEQQSVPPFGGIVRQLWDENRVQATAVVPQRHNIAPGKVIRAFILVYRSAAGVRQAGLTRVSIKYGDDTLLFEGTEQDIVEEMFRQYGRTTAFPTGVYAIPFCADNDGFVGSDFRRDLLDTRRLSQFWIEVTTSNTGNIDLIHDELIVPANMSI